jgi:hypothetical protein
VPVPSTSRAEPADRSPCTGASAYASDLLSPSLTGSCGCGAVRFEVAEPLVAAAYCHCTRCQKRTGTASQASAKVVPGSVTVIAGTDLLRDWSPPGALDKTFCGECGSHLFARRPGSGEIVFVRMAAIDGDPVVRPAAHQFVA